MIRLGWGRALITAAVFAALYTGLTRPATALDEQLLAELRGAPRGFGLAMSLAETTEWDAVISLAEMQSAAAVPAKARKLFRKALKEDRKKRTREAIQLLLRAVSLAPGYFQAYGALAVGYLELGDLAEANRYAGLALLMNPDYLPGREIQAVIRLVEGRHREAAAILRDLAKRSPTRRTVHYFLAKALLRIGETDSAEEHLARADALRRRQSIPRLPARIPDWNPLDLHLPWRW